MRKKFDAGKMTSYPVYLLKLGDSIKVIFPENKEDLDHLAFWEQTARHVVAKHYGLSAASLLDLPYCQRRARICGNKIYYGEKPSKTLRESIRKATDEPKLEFAYDEHESRFSNEVFEFKLLLRLKGPCQ